MNRIASITKWLAMLAILTCSLAWAQAGWKRLAAISRRHSGMVFTWVTICPKGRWPRTAARALAIKDRPGVERTRRQQGKLILFHRIEDQEQVDCLGASDGKKIWSSHYPTHYQDDFGFDPRAAGHADYR